MRGLHQWIYLLTILQTAVFDVWCSSCASVKSHCFFHQLFGSTILPRKMISFFCAAFSDHDHERTVELQNKAGGQKYEADPCGGLSRGSGLIDVQGSLVHHLQSDGGRVTWTYVKKSSMSVTTCPVLTSETDSFRPSAMPLKSASPNMSVIPIWDGTSFSE